MISLHKVELLVFDLDGTIVPSARTTYKAIKRAFAKLNLAVRFAEKDIERYFGKGSDEFYQAITPAETTLSWQDIRAKVREEYDSALHDYAEPYPGVKEALETLRKRGYKLALESNARVKWFDSTLSALGIRGYFDYAECIEENNLTKSELVRKIKVRFGHSEAAVIGDRVYDIEAARESNSLSIGALYGYGGKEPEQADMTIASFSSLLEIFDRRNPVFEEILKNTRERKTDRAFVVGITGLDLAGKTRFARAFSSYLTSQGLPTQLIHLDDFHNPQKLRYEGENEAENYFRRSFNLETLVEKLLDPIRRHRRFETGLTLLDLNTDRYEAERRFAWDESTIVIFEGVFLFRPELAPYIDYKVYLDISLEELRRRARTRDVPLHGEVILEKYERKYIPAQMKYLEEFKPQQTADMVIDNSNWEYPLVKRF